MKLTNYLFTLTTIFCLQTFSLMAQYNPIEGKLTTGAPEDVGMSAEHLAHIEDLCKSYLDNNWLPGGTILIARHGKIIYFKEWGIRDAEAQEPYRKDDIFRIASMTKAFTTVAVLQLFEQGKFGLDDPISWYLPNFKKAQKLDTFNEKDSTYTSIPAEKAITIRHLLTHTSGIAYDFMDPRISAIFTKNGTANLGLSHETKTTKDIVDIFANQPLLHEPGTKWTYGYNKEILGYLIEVLTGQTLGEYCQEHIFKPLGMEDTGFYFPIEKAERLVPVYYDDREKKALLQYDKDVFEYPLFERDDHFAGGGGASSTTEDYAVFCQMLLNKGTYNGNRILSPKTIELMTSDQLEYLGIQAGRLVGEKGTSFGLGFSIRTENNRAASVGSVGTFAWGGLFNTKFWIDPVEDMVFVGMTQIFPDYHPEFWDRLYAIIYGAVEE